MAVATEEERPFLKSGWFVNFLLRRLALQVPPPPREEQELRLRSVINGCGTGDSSSFLCCLGLHSFCMILVINSY